MDVDLWTSRVHSTNHLTAAATMHQASRLMNTSADVDEDVQACFPCPFCYVEIEVPLLCTHLQEEHCFDVKNSVCPVCAENLGKDMIGHFTVQHSHMLKRRRKSQKMGPWNGSSGMAGKDLRELSSFVGIHSTKGRVSVDSAADPLLSPFLCSISLPEPKANEEPSADVKISTISDLPCKESSTRNEAQEQDYQERSERAEFFQQLVLSTIF